MYIPNFQNLVAAGLALTGMGALKPNKIAHGSVTDYAVEKCLDLDGTKRCTTPFKVSKSTCYTIKWSTDGAISHTTAEVRDAGSNEIVYYRDTDGDWTAEKGELVYVDFKPKVPGQGNHTVDYDIRTCE
ncbi:CND01770-like protein [Dioszegia hungarica]|uniref:CND01770-like protein n=1 Tax=Dioszegia hungarica TaxID=4972 RepID=A0AA38HB37_9TREE|nr:CND01770-like protein [Dioszegia hungarica]KAI9636244.1 CND01770-like protein [Dioszegia hungarica]